MKGDFTRSTWDPKKHFSSVRMQQGRVQVDADWNEQSDIVEHLRETGARDVIGAAGVPRSGGGFHVQITGGGADLTLTAGRIYVDGILCEAETPFRYSQQTDLPGAPLPPDLGLPAADLPGPYLVYLDVWRRHVTALEDPAIREVALGGPDTATREQVVRQVKLLRARFSPGVSPNCSAEDPQGWTALTAPSSGRLRARTQAGATQTDPCIVPAQAGYTRLENQLYRVEVHDGGTVDTATFKWSRNNGAVVTEWLAQDGDELTVRSTGPDKLTGFHDARWVELTDDTRELQGRPGLLVRVSRVEGEVIEIDPEGQTVDRTAFPRNPKVRRWDLPDTATGAETVEIPAGNQGYLALENGIEIRFEAGTYRTGDFWTIPARSFVGEFAGEIEWPQEAPGQGRALAPEGIGHHYSKLGFVAFNGTVFTSVLTDCRLPFPALTELRRFYPAGGDGQQALPGTFLPCTLRVAAANGQHPMVGARVRFEVGSTHGLLERPDSTLATTAVVQTSANGVAECRWQLPPQVPASGSRCLRATAFLLNPDGTDAATPPVSFSAEIPEAKGVVFDPSSCPPLQQVGADTVQKAIEEICQALSESGIEPGIRVQEVLTPGSGRPVLNDARVLPEDLAGGLEVICDGDVDPAAFFKPPSTDVEPAKPNFVVTLDLPYPLGDEKDLWFAGRYLGFQPVILRGTVEAEGNIIRWTPHDETAHWLEGHLFDFFNDDNPDRQEDVNRFLCHLTLRGNFIWNEGAKVGQPPSLFLDGDAYGLRASDRVDLRLPSGDSRRGGDFRLWFWLERNPPSISLSIPSTEFGVTIAIATVRNQDGLPVPGATVTATGPVTRTSTTNTSGQASLINLPPGSYSATATFDLLTATTTFFAGGVGIRGLAGVGETFQARLEDAGISTVEELATHDVAELAEILQTSESRAEKIRDTARAEMEKRPAPDEKQEGKDAKGGKRPPKGGTKT